MNEIVNLVNNRKSIRRYSKEKITDNELEVILDSTMRSPTAGNMMLYSILKIKDQKKKDILSKTCDNQSFIKDADTILVFLADLRRWYDFYRESNVLEFCEKNNLDYRTPDEGDLFLAMQDAIIAAQTSTLVAESLNIGSCYIGDIIENYEEHKKLFKLPKWTMPVCMLCLGKYENSNKNKTNRFDKEYIVFDEEYKRFNKKELDIMFKDKIFPKNNIYNADNFGRFNYARKTGANFSEEMGRSVREMLKDWCDFI